MKYTIGFLNEKHLPLVMALQEVIVQNLERPDLLHSFSHDFMKQHMKGRGVALGVFVQNRLVAFRNLYYPEPRDKEWNLGLDLGLAEEALAKVANLQMVCVHPRYRGNGLALKMNQISMDLLRKRGTHPHVCATVSPYNIWNIPILLASGFRIAKLKSKYGGKVRYIVYQDLRNPNRFDDQSAVQVRLDDLDTQKKWLYSGFCGVALRRRQIRSREDSVRGFDLVLKAPVKQCTNDFDVAPWSLGKTKPYFLRTQIRQADACVSLRRPRRRWPALWTAARDACAESDLHDLPFKASCTMASL